MASEFRRTFATALVSLLSVPPTAVAQPIPLDFGPLPAALLERLPAGHQDPGSSPPNSQIPVRRLPAPDPSIPLSKLLIQHWGIDDGLPIETLIDVHRSRDGFLWISSFNGLFRFDGSNFEVFDKSTHPELVTSAFSRFFEDADGTLWLGTQGSGIWQIRNGRLQPFDQARLGVISLSLDRSEEHGFWIGMDTGLYRHEGNRFVQLILDDFGETRARDTLFDQEGNLWVASESHGVARIRDGKVRWWTEQDGLSARASVCLWHDGRRLWVGGIGGLSVIENDVARPVAGFEGASLLKLVPDSFGMIWIPASSGLIRLDPTTEIAEVVQEIDGHSLRNVSDVALDDEGNVWVTSSVSGLFQLRTRRFETYGQDDGLSTARVNYASEIEPMVYWLGMDDGKTQRLDLSRPEGPKLTDVVFDVALPEVRIRHFLEDSKGRTWVSSYAGLLRRDASGDLLLGTQDGLPSLQVRLTYEDSRGLLWVATRNGGLAVERNGTFESFGPQEGLPSGLVLSVDEDSAGRLLVGMRGSFAVLSVQETPWKLQVDKVYTHEDGLPGAVVFNTHVDGEWIFLATDGGLAALKDGRLEKLDLSDGLTTDTVFDIKTDKTGRAWLSSLAGVMTLDGTSLRERLEAKLAGRLDLPSLELDTFDHADGLSARQCTAATSFTIGHDGRILFPTLEGLSIIDPRNLSVNPVPPPIHIYRADVDQSSFTFGVGSEPSLLVPPGHRRVAFSFAGLSLQQPKKNRLWYRLEGFDRHWTEAHETRVAYTNLPHGTYQFRVVGTNNDRVPNPIGDTLTVKVKPQLYQTPFFFFAMLALGLGLVRAFVNWRIQFVHRRNRELQDIVDVQRRTAQENRRLIIELETKNAEIEARREELERFTYTVSHDLKSPLVTIRGFAGALRQDIENGDHELVEQDLGLILSASKRMERLLAELLELSQVGHVQNPPEQVDLSEIVADAVALTAGRARAQRGEILVQADMPVLWVDRSRITEVFQNLLENALKFVPGDRSPRIHVGCDSLDGEHVFFVQDNGIGIPADLQGSIFGLFKRLNPTTEGSGVGLAVVKRTVENHGGRIWVESLGDQLGTTFRFTLRDLETGVSRNEESPDPTCGNMSS